MNAEPQRAVGAAPATWWSAWRTVLMVAPPCWALVFVIEIANMEAWRVASTELEVAEPLTRALQFLLLLPVLLFACRAALGVGYRPPQAPLRFLGQLALWGAFAVLARPALMTASWLIDPPDTAAQVAASLFYPTRESLAVWIASTAAMALNYALCLGIVVGVTTYHDLESERVLRAEVQRQAVQARLQALTNQLNPHFLFNALNTIVSLIETEPKLAQTMVTRVADLLRRILSDGATQFVSLQRELDLLQHYLEIQEMRFPKRLSHELKIGASAAEALVPSLVMQPIIENAVVHGLRNDDNRVHVLIEADISGPTLAVRVSNPGRVVPPGEPAPRPGIGLGNVAERLRALFGEQAAVELEMPAPGRYVALVRMPALLAGATVASWTRPP